MRRRSSRSGARRSRTWLNLGAGGTISPVDGQPANRILSASVNLLPTALTAAGMDNPFLTENGRAHRAFTASGLHLSCNLEPRLIQPISGWIAVGVANPGLNSPIVAQTQVPTIGTMEGSAHFPLVLPITIGGASDQRSLYRASGSSKAMRKLSLGDLLYLSLWFGFNTPVSGSAANVTYSATLRVLAIA